MHEKRTYNWRIEIKKIKKPLILNLEASDMKSHRKLCCFEVIKVKHCIFLKENEDLYLSAFKNADSCTYVNKIIANG